MFNVLLLLQISLEKNLMFHCVGDIANSLKEYQVFPDGSFYNFIL